MSHSDAAETNIVTFDAIIQIAKYVTNCTWEEYADKDEISKVDFIIGLSYILLANVANRDNLTKSENLRICLSQLAKNPSTYEDRLCDEGFTVIPQYIGHNSYGTGPWFLRLYSGFIDVDGCYNTNFYEDRFALRAWDMYSILNKQYTGTLFADVMFDKDVIIKYSPFLHFLRSCIVVADYNCQKHDLHLKSLSLIVDGVEIPDNIQRDEAENKAGLEETQSIRGSLHCRHCGKEIEKDSLFCRYCGKPQEEKKKRWVNIKKGHYIAAAGILVVCLLLFLPPFIERREKIKLIETGIVYYVSSGNRYHLYPECSNMRNPKEKQEVQFRGTKRTRCSKCYAGVMDVY